MGPVLRCVGALLLSWHAAAAADAAAAEQCPLKVLGAGFGRTGTLSLKTALDQIDLRCYHMKEVFEKGLPHITAWEDFAHGAPLDWAWLFDGFDAAVDFPVSATQSWTEIFKRCPDVKVILTERDSATQWADSFLATIGTLYATFPFSVLKKVVPPFRHHCGMWTKLMAVMMGLDEVRELTPADRAVVVEAYEKNSEVARKLVPEKRLLVYNVKEGWAPLCAFLADDMVGPCPTGPFPRTNERAEFQLFALKVTAGLLFVPTAVAAVVLYGLRRALRAGKAKAA